jgi:hypothetical protein
MVMFLGSVALVKVANFSEKLATLTSSGAP